jgi:chromosome segregation ATPase
VGGPSEREYVEKLGKIKQKLNQKVGDVRKQFEKIEKAKVDLLKKTKEMKHDAEREAVKMENDIVKSKDLAPESKRRLRLEIDVLKSEIRERYAELEARIAEAIAPV